jgi:hypothetical protein
MIKGKQPIMSTDDAMRNIWLRLHSDLAKNVENNFEEQYTALKNCDYAGYRKLKHAYVPFFGQSFTVKARCQLDGFLDRYTFKQDLMSEEERTENTFSELLHDQARISSFHEYTPSVNLVMREARRIIKGILGSYNLEEHYEGCQFGRRASVGNPYSRAYLDVKLTQDPLTGSIGHIRWFKSYLRTDRVLLSVLAERSKTRRAFTVCTELSQSFAPKSHKKVRGIVPNTLLGTFYTYGLGVVLVQRLRDAGLDITRLQDIHKRIAQSGSLRRHIVTADLKAASDSITGVLVQKLFPREWWNVLRCGRIPYIRFNKVSYRTDTFAGMGNGFTFPMQTLIFYSILKAIGNLTSIKGKYSVYGDDLIYPSPLHKYVVPVLEELGFRLNPEKTYCKLFFRESCGGDFYHGVDVRPVRPQGQSELLGRKRFATFLYKIRNGLNRKWDIEELPITFAFIDVLIVKTIGHLHVVPPLFPDTAGIKSTTVVPTAYGNLPKAFGFPMLLPKYNVAKQHWTFWYLASRNGKRQVLSCNPYYWVALKGKEGLPPESWCKRWHNLTDMLLLSWAYKVSWTDQHGGHKSYLAARRPKASKLKGKKTELVPVTPDRRLSTVAEDAAIVFEWPEVASKN